MKNELIKLYNKMVQGEKIKIILSNGLELYIDFTDAIGRNTENIIIIRSNGVNTVLNPDHVVMVSLIIPRRWFIMIDKKKPALHKKYTFYEFVVIYSDIFYVIACFAVTLIIILLIVGCCTHFNVSFTESGMMRNFLVGGVWVEIFRISFFV